MQTLTRQVPKFGQFDINTMNPKAHEGHIVIGEKGGGKSALGEAMAIEMYKRGVIIFDAIDANDNESQFYAIPKTQREICFPTLLIHPPTYDVQVPDKWGHIRPMCSDEGLLKILTTAKADRRIVSMACLLWPRGTVGKVLSDWFFQFPTVQRKLKHHVFLFMREVGHYAFSQLRVFKEVEDQFRAAATYIVKEGRHHRITFFFDLQRAVDLYKGIRTLCDHIHIKRSAKSMIPKELEWVFPAIEEARERFSPEDYLKRAQLFPLIQKLWKREYYSLDKSEEIRPVRRFRMAGFRHKTPSDDFEDLTGVQFIRNAIVDEDATLSPEEYEVILASRLNDRGVPYAWVSDVSPLDTPASTLRNRCKTYRNKGVVIVK